MKSKPFYLLVLAALLVPLGLQALPQLAVLDAVLGPGMDKAAISPVTDKIIEELVHSKKYRVIDRSNVEEVLREKEFQLSSGVVKTEEVRQAGEYLGADLVVIASATRVGTTHVITAKMIDVVTGEIVAQASAEQKGAIDVLLEVARTVGRELAGLEVEEPVLAEARAEAEAKTEEAAEVKPAPAAPAKSDPMITIQMQSLIKSRAHMNNSGRMQMMQLADQLSEQDRLMLYTANAKKDAGIALLLNLLLTSLGSWIQGDVAGALLELGIMTVAIVGVSVGYTEYYDPYYGYYSSEPNAFYYTGLGLIAVNIIFMCVRPFTYQRSFNNNLARGLKTIALSILDEERSTFAVRVTERGPEWKLGLSLVSLEY
jgi:TolB-like protein